MDTSIVAEYNRLKLILESTSEGWWEWDIVANTTYHSDQWYMMLGYAPTEFSSSLEMWLTLIHPNDKEGTFNAQLEYMKYDKKWELIFRMKSKENGYKWILSRGKVVKRDALGNAIKAVGIHIDITEKKQLTELEEKYQRKEELLNGFIKVAHSSFKIYDFIESKFIYNSGAILKNLGYTKQFIEELGKNFVLQLIHPEDQKSFHDYINLLRASPHKKNYKIVFRVKAKSGEYRWLSSQDSILRRDEKGKSTQIVGSIIDITQQKNLETQIEEHITYLEGLSYINSHEVRGPVATLLGLINLIKAENHDIPADVLVNYLERSVLKLDEIIKSLNTEIDDLLNKKRK